MTNPTHNDKITVAAPGQNIYTTSRAAANAYVYDNGTSFASPYVAAVAGIAKSIDPDLTPAHFIELIAQTADKSFLGKGYDDYYGYGVLNAGALIEALINEKSDSIYFSPADYLADGSYTTTAYNASDTELNLGLIEKHETAGKPTAFRFLNIPLAKESVYEIAVPLPHAQENLPQEPEQSETELLSSTEPDTTLYILNPFTLTPWRSPIKY